MLSNTEIASMRDVLEAWLPDTCTIQTKTESVDALGGVTHTWTSAYTNVPCRVDPAGGGQGLGSETVVNLALEGQSAWVLNIPHDQAITVESRVIYSGVTYEVRGLIDNQSFNLNRQAVIVRKN